MITSLSSYGMSAGLSRVSAKQLPQKAQTKANLPSKTNHVVRNCFLARRPVASSGLPDVHSSISSRRLSYVHLELSALSRNTQANLVGASWTRVCQSRC